MNGYVAGGWSATAAILALYSWRVRHRGQLLSRALPTPANPGTQADQGIQPGPGGEPRPVGGGGVGGVTVDADVPAPVRPVTGEGGAWR